MSENNTLSYIHRDHLTGTALMTDENSNQIDTTVKYYPYGDCRNSQPKIDDFPTDKLFTGQRLDGTGLYFYGARYYDPLIGRFISPDTIIPNPANPQSFNRYSYCLNNPLKYIDPTGHKEGDLSWSVAGGWTVENDKGEQVSVSDADVNAAIDAYKVSSETTWSGFVSSGSSGLPIESSYEIVWGYEGKGGITYQYEKSVIVVKNNACDYYRLTKTGHGVLSGAGVDLDIY